MNNEPVAWRTIVDGKTYVTDDNEFVVKMWRHNGWKEEPLYTHPANKKVEKNTDLYEKVCNCTKKLDLTDEEIEEVFRTVEQDFALTESKKSDGGWRNFPVELGRAILRKAQEK